MNQLKKKGCNALKDSLRHSELKQFEGYQQEYEAAKKSSIAFIKNQVQYTQIPSKQPTPENTYVSLLNLLSAYNILDDLSMVKEKKKQKKEDDDLRQSDVKRSFKKMFTGLGDMMKKTDQKNHDMKWSDVNKTIQIFLLMTDLSDLHQMYLDFYSIFDEQQNFIIELGEFYHCLDFMTNSVYMGKDKMELVLKGVQSSLSSGQQLPDFGGLLDEGDKNQLKDTEKEELFDAFQETHAAKDKDEPFINFLKFFGTYFSFFLEFTKKRIDVRKEKLDLIMGKEKIHKSFEKEVPVQNFYTLIEGFKILGYDFFDKDQKKSKDISFRQIQQVLISYKNANDQIYDSQTINYILKELEKYMNVDPLTKVERKKRKLNKIIRWLGMKLGLYSCLQNLRKHNCEDKFRYREEVLLWNCAKAYEDFFKPKILNKRIAKFLRKFQRHHEGCTFNKKHIEQFISKFFQKKLPQVKTKYVKEMIDFFIKNEFYGETEIVAASVSAQKMLPMFYNQIEKKMKHYIEKQFHLVNEMVPPSITPRNNSDNRFSGITPKNQRDNSYPKSKNPLQFDKHKIEEEDEESEDKESQDSEQKKSGTEGEFQDKMRIIKFRQDSMKSDSEKSNKEDNQKNISMMIKGDHNSKLSNIPTIINTGSISVQQDVQQDLQMLQKMEIINNIEISNQDQVKERQQISILEQNEEDSDIDCKKSKIEKKQDESLIFDENIDDEFYKAERIEITFDKDAIDANFVMETFVQRYIYFHKNKMRKNAKLQEEHRRQQDILLQQKLKSLHTQERMSTLQEEQNEQIKTQEKEQEQPKDDKDKVTHEPMDNIDQPGHDHGFNELQKLMKKKQEQEKHEQEEQKQKELEMELQKEHQFTKSIFGVSNLHIYDSVFSKKEKESIQKMTHIEKNKQYAPTRYHQDVFNEQELNDQNILDNQKESEKQDDKKSLISKKSEGQKSQASKKTIQSQQKQSEAKKQEEKKQGCVIW